MNILSVTKINAIFLAIVILVSTVIGISSPLLSTAAYGETYQNAKCDNKNVYINEIEQEQIQQRRSENNNNFDVTVNGQQVTPKEEALTALTGSNGNSNGNGEPLLNFERNIVNVCSNFGNKNNPLVYLPLSLPSLPKPPIIPIPPLTNDVYVVWEDNAHGNREIFFAASNDKGQTFSTPINISNTPGNSFNPRIISEGNNVYVVWEDNAHGNREIFFAASNDKGQTFNVQAENISNTPGTSSDAQIISKGNNVYVVWYDYTPDRSDIFFAVSTDNGQTFTTPAENISNTAGESIDPQIISEGNNVYVVWYDSTPGNSDIFFAASNDKGQTFNVQAENISNNAGDSRFPQISSTP